MPSPALDFPPSVPRSVTVYAGGAAAAASRIPVQVTSADSKMVRLMVRYLFMSVFSITGLRYNQKVIAPGAQTERRGDAGPVRSLLRGKPHRPLFAKVRSSGQELLERAHS